LIAASNFIDTAKPPASSDELVIFDPLDNRAKLFCNITLLLFKFIAAVLAEMFVLMTTLISAIPFLEFNCDFRVAPGNF
jgi:hypothetical protein